MKNVIKKNFFSWEYLEWDSKILERRVAKIVSFVNDRQSIDQLLKSFLDEKIVYATFRIKADDFLTIHALEKEGFRVVDGLICLESQIKPLGDKISNNTRFATDNDLEALTILAGDSFSKTRFYNDPLIKKQQANKIYSEWIKNSINGLAADKVFVFEDKGKILGFITVRKSGNIVLIAVDKRERGKGIGKSLIVAILNQFREWGLKKSTIETQMTNISALRVYQSCGYKIIGSYLTLRWSKDEN